MRVLQFGRFWNDQHGGIERHAALLSRELATLGVDVVNLVAADRPQGSDTQVDGYRLVQAPSHGRAVSTAISPELVFKALSLNREKPFDVIHLHLPDPLSHLASMVMPSGPKRVITWHSDIIKQKRLQRIYQPFINRLLTGADAVIGATEAHFSTSRQIPDAVPPSKRHVIPFGLDFDTLALTPAVEAQVAQLKARAGGRPIIFALGRHVYYKGFAVLVEAMRQVQGLLILGGDGPLREALQGQAAQSGVADKVWFTGRIPEAEIAAYFQACDLFCLPSVELSEAFGLVQLEAMACGKPVVCTQLNNGVNVVNQNGVTGLAVPVRDPGALAAAINRLMLDSALRERLGQQARTRALTEYSLEAMGRRHLALYEELCAHPG